MKKHEKKTVNVNPLSNQELIDSTIILQLLPLPMTVPV